MPSRECNVHCSHRKMANASTCPPFSAPSFYHLLIFVQQGFFLGGFCSVLCRFVFLVFLFMSASLCHSLLWRLLLRRRPVSGLWGPLLVYQKLAIKQRLLVVMGRSSSPPRRFSSSHQGNLLSTVPPRYQLATVWLLPEKLLLETTPLVFVFSFSLSH